MLSYFHLLSALTDDFQVGGLVSYACPCSYLQISRDSFCRHFSPSYSYFSIWSSSYDLQLSCTIWTKTVLQGIAPYPEEHQQISNWLLELALVVVLRDDG